MVTTYTSGNNQKIVVKDLGDKKLLKLYRFFKDYVRGIELVINRSENAQKDNKYLEFAEQMIDIKNSLREEIKIRRLRVGDTDLYLE